MVNQLRKTVKQMWFTPEAEAGIIEWLEPVIEPDTMVMRFWDRTPTTIGVGVSSGTYWHNGSNEGVLWVYSNKENTLWIKKQ
jgi:hypothetical protein